MKKIKYYKKHILLVLLVCISGFLYFYGFTYAKYVSDSVWDYYLRSRGFYFSSDHLSSSTAKNVNNLWDGESVYFNIKNNLNQAVITEYDINYTVVCTIEGEASSYKECHINDSGLNTIDGVLSSSQTCSNITGDGIDVSSFSKTDCELGGYKWVTHVATKELYFDVVLTDHNYDLTDVVVNIEVASTSPYRKTLSGDFMLYKRNIEEDDIIINYRNHTTYDRLTVSNSYLSDKCVNITWNSDNLLIDTDTSYLSSYSTDINGYINDIKFNIEGKRSLSYIFYSRDFDIKHNVTDFSVEETDGC